MQSLADHAAIMLSLPFITGGGFQTAHSSRGAAAPLDPGAQFHIALSARVLRLQST